MLRNRVLQIKKTAVFWNSTVVILLLGNTPVRNTTSGYHPMPKLFYIRMNTSVAFPIFHFLVNLILTPFCSSENVTWKTSRVNFFIKRHSCDLIWVNGRSSMCIQQKISRSLKGWTVANLQAWSHVILLPNSTGLIFFFKENLTLKMRKKKNYW